MPMRAEEIKMQHSLDYIHSQHKWDNFPTISWTMRYGSDIKNAATLNLVYSYSTPPLFTWEQKLHWSFTDDRNHSIFDWLIDSNPDLYQLSIHLPSQYKPHNQIKNFSCLVIYHRNNYRRLTVSSGITKMTQNSCNLVTQHTISTIQW